MCFLLLLLRFSLSLPCEQKRTKAEDSLYPTQLRSTLSTQMCTKLMNYQIEKDLYDCSYDYSS